MNNSFLDECGKILSDRLPAIYLDTSFLVHYWLVEGREIELPERDRISVQPYETEIRNIVRESKRYESLVNLRKFLIFDTVEALPIYTPLAMLELQGWYAEAAFKQIAGNTVGVMTIQRESRKRIGDFLHELHNRWQAEEKTKQEKGSSTPPASILMSETYLNWSFADCHGLQGLVALPLKNFNILQQDVFGEAGLYAFLQVGLADILHILAAHHLGCTYFASFDSDFKRIRHQMSQQYGLQLLSSPEEIQKILKKGNHSS